MVRFSIRMLRIRFGSNFQSNASHLFRNVQICIRIFRIPSEWFEFAFECFESLLNGSNLHFNASNSFQTVRICIRMIRISFEWFEFAFEWFESISNGSNLQSNASNASNASNPFRIYRICFWVVRIPFEWFEFLFEHLWMQILTIRTGLEKFECKFEPFERDSKYSNANLNHSKKIQSIRLQIRTIWKGFEAFECKLQPFERDSMLRILFEWFKFAFECFESVSNGSNLHSTG